MSHKVGITLDDEVYEAAAALAAEQERTVANLARYAVRRYLSQMKVLSTGRSRGRPPKRPE